MTQQYGRQRGCRGTAGAVLLVLLLWTTDAARAATIVVNSTADPGPGNCTTTCTLRTAIATAGPGDEITFSVTGTIILSGTQLTIDKDLTLTGPGASSLAVSGNNASRVMQVNTGVTVVLSGLTIQNGSDPGFDGGGGIRNNGTLTLANVTLSGVTKPSTPAAASTTWGARPRWPT
jgi:CSLREA domain-containing protein